MTPKAKEPAKPATEAPDASATSDGVKVDKTEPYPPAAKSGEAKTVEVAPGQFLTPVAGLPPRRECVVDDGTPHVGGAVNGVVCSAHAYRYHPDGKLRP